MTDIPLSEYIRRRRLTQAALDLQHTDKRIIDIAVKYGYQSADAFTRAFANIHGLVPSKAREQGVVLKAYPRITFTLSLKGVVAMKYRIEEKKSFRVVGVKERYSTDIEESFEKLPKMWGKYNANGITEIIYKLSNEEPCGCMGICGPVSNDMFDYWIAVSSSKECPPNMREMEIPASTWAIFEVIGPMPKAIQEANRRIYTEWFPTTGYKHTMTAELELYLEGNTDSPDYKSEIWIPVVKK